MTNDKKLQKTNTIDNNDNIYNIDNINVTKSLEKEKYQSVRGGWIEKIIIKRL